MRYWRGYLIAAIVGLITLGLTLLAQQYSQLVDAFYPFLTREVQTVLAGWSGTVEVTVWQVAAMLLILGLLLTVVLMIALKWNFFQWLGWVLAGASMIWMLHTGIYGLNYYAGPLSEDVHLDSYDFTVDDMADATIFFRDKANALAEQLPRDSKGNLLFSDFETLAAQAGEGFHTLTYEQSGSVFAGSLVPVKKLAWADLYTSMGILGITMPLTGEAAVNPQIPVVSMPFTMCHEMAHRMCIATESDANMAAFLACRVNPSVEYQYSAYFMAYRYCYNAIAKLGTVESQQALQRVKSGIGEALYRDLAAYNDFFAEKKDESATQLADTVNDTYIKAQGDERGVESYGAVCDLLVSWHIQTIVLPSKVVEDTKFDPYDESQVDLSGIVNAPTKETEPAQ